MAHHFYAAALLSLVTLSPAVMAASAEQYPGKPITLIAPIPPDGMTDALARMLSQKMTEHWK